jgi:hypothetical protein
LGDLEPNCGVEAAVLTELPPDLGELRGKVGFVGGDATDFSCAAAVALPFFFDVIPVDNSE